MTERQCFNVAMDPIYNKLVANLDRSVIHNFISNRSITFYNAWKCKNISSEKDIFDIILKMVTISNPVLVLNTFKRRLDGFCSINSVHRDPRAQKSYYSTTFNNVSKTYCNNCVDVIIRFSNTMIRKLGNKQYKKLQRTYLLIKRSFVKDFLDIDCFNQIIYYLFDRY